MVALSWPSGWLTAVRESTAADGAPVVMPSGRLVLFALFRWRRPEARLLTTLARVPQTMPGDELLPIVALVGVKREAVGQAVHEIPGSRVPNYSMRVPRDQSVR